MDELTNIDGWLTESKSIGTIIFSISEALELLKSKRVTLEEKIIARNLYELSASYGELIKRINLLLLKELQVPDETVAQIRQLNRQVTEVMADFLKIVRYDLNFLEQYYEHGFVARLTQEYRFAESLNQIVQAIPDPV